METFSPHFSHALARFIARETKKAPSAPVRAAGGGKPPRKQQPRRGSGAGDRGSVGNASEDNLGKGLVLYEAGGGTGTNALNVLDYLRREEPRLYDRTEYTIVEISPRLAELQTERVCAVHEVRKGEEAREALVERSNIAAAMARMRSSSRKHESETSLLLVHTGCVRRVRENEPRLA